MSLTPTMRGAFSRARAVMREEGRSIPFVTPASDGQHGVSGVGVGGKGRTKVVDYGGQAEIPGGEADVAEEGVEHGGGGEGSAKVAGG